MTTPFRQALPTDLALKLDLNERCDGPPGWCQQVIIPPHYYWQYIGRAPLEADLAAHFGLNTDQVLACNGGDESILYLFNHQAPGTAVILPLPTFGVYLEQAPLARLNLVTLPPRQELLLDLDHLERELPNYPGALVVVVRPNNPTGEHPARERIEQLLSACASAGATLLLDEAYAEFAQDHMVDALRQYTNLVILRTFSKAYGFAGLRIGYLLGHASLIGALKQRALPYNLSSISLLYAQEALRRGPQTEMNSYCQTIKRNRDQLYEMLRALKIECPESEANFLCMNLGIARASFVAAVLAQRGVLARLFTRPGQQGLLRLTIPSEIDALKEILQQSLQPDLICLDIDGCLINTHTSFDTVVKKVVHHFLGESCTDDEMLAVRRLGGYNDDNLLAWEIIRRRGGQVSLEEVIPVFREYYIGRPGEPGLYQMETPIIRPKLLQQLRDKYSVALITGRNHEEAPLALELLGIDEMAIWTVDDVAAGKPDPEGILAAMQQFKAATCWMVGDNVDDILAAKNAGAVAIGVGRYREALQAAGAVVVLQDINGLEDLY